MRGLPGGRMIGVPIGGERLRAVLEVVQHILSIFAVACLQVLLELAVAVLEFLTGLLLEGLEFVGAERTVLKRSRVAKTAWKFLHHAAEVLCVANFTAECLTGAVDVSASGAEILPAGDTLRATLLLAALTRRAP